jgi:hypothetical protein
MFFRKVQLVAQIVGLVTILVLSVLGVVALASGSNPVSMALAPTTLSGVPNVINYQGMLREPDGTPINGPYTMTFKLYDDPVIGTALFTDTLQNIVVRDGLFTVLLGDSEGNEIGAALFAQPLYVGIQVEDNAEMAPRQRIAPVPYAVQLTDGIYVDGDSNVGVGTKDPVTKLHIEGGTDAGLTTDGFLVAGAKSGANIVIDDDEIMARNNGAASTLHLQYDGGDVHVGGKITVDGWETTDILYPGDGFWGEWSGWQWCPPGSYVGGLNVRIESDQGGGDDTAMNGIRVVCKTLGQ